MKIKYSKTFIKHTQQRISCYPSLKKKFENRLKLFLKNPNHPVPILKAHKLTGAKYPFRLFSITGDIRVIYLIEDDYVEFYDVGSHNQVY